MARQLSLLGLPALVALAALFVCVSSQTVAKKPLTVNDGAKPCLLVYARSARTRLFTKDGKEPVEKEHENPTVETNGSSCVVGQAKGDKLALKFDNELVVSWDFKITETAWDLIPTNVEYNKQKFTPGKSAVVSNNMGFSYSCQRTQIPVLQVGEGGEYVSGTIEILGFQVQPYTKDGLIRFDDSSDCAVWFTLPIFMGLFVILLLITIQYFGVTALMSISTPDRFENPKGRTLIITNFDE